ncbi:MAG TPA: metal-dependent hydrolase [Chloroflexota bacterium]|jgi:predicted metal-dependent TIM-barrel fold hydrolase|nr:metal-dependent hydrolase [Chloroflexota bacterium]
MEYIDIHSHMGSRTTDDYEQMALTGCVALTEPAFWAGYDRGSAEAFRAYFEQLTDFEPKRAAKYGIKHFTWLCLNPKEADDRALAADVLPLIPEYLDRPNVIGIGEIGLNRVTRNELATMVDHIDLAMQYDQIILVHTPHLEDKYKGTKVIVDTMAADGRIRPSRVLIDHAEEHTMPMIQEAGFWAGITLYPQTKVSPGRAVDMIEIFGSDRICVASACDWGPSVPTAMAHFVLEMRRRGHPDRLIRKIVYENPIEFLSQSPKFELPRIEKALAAR